MKITAWLLMSATLLACSPELPPQPSASAVVAKKDGDFAPEIAKLTAAAQTATQPEPYWETVQLLRVIEQFGLISEKPLPPIDRNLPVQKKRLLLAEHIERNTVTELAKSRDEFQKLSLKQPQNVALRDNYVLLIAAQMAIEQSFIQQLRQNQKPTTPPELQQQYKKAQQTFARANADFWQQIHTLLANTPTTEKP